MKATWDGFRSISANDIKNFLTHKRALKRRYDTEEAALRLLDRYLVEHRVTSATHVTPELIETFLKSRPRRRPRSYNNLLGVVARFFDWLVRQRVLTNSPVHVRPRQPLNIMCPHQRGPPE